MTASFSRIPHGVIRVPRRAPWKYDGRRITVSRRVGYPLRREKNRSVYGVRRDWRYVHAARENRRAAPGHSESGRRSDSRHRSNSRSAVVCLHTSRVRDEPAASVGEEKRAESRSGETVTAKRRLSARPVRRETPRRTTRPSRSR